MVESARELERRGAELVWLPVDSHGRIDASAAAERINRRTTLVSVGWANNEIGTVQEVDAIAEMCRERRVPLHSDAVQAFGKISCRVPGADLISITAHKIGGPKGIGALLRRGDTPLRPLLYGGSQERGLRPGTENVAAACGFAAAVALADSRGPWSERLRERLWSGIADIPGAARYSPADGCLPNTLLAGFAGLRGESVVAALDLERIAVSVGSACSAGSGEPSHVLQALGHDDDAARAGVRFSSGPTTTEADIDQTVTVLRRVVERMRSVASQAAAEERR